MRSAHLAALLTLFSLTHAFPSKPLNQRPSDLAWEAWLLVDQSNRQSDLGLLRRRITPKSVFIAPTFSPELLPACADGYKSDFMGRCVKIIKINESIHFDFLLQKLNARFPVFEPPPQPQGPLQLNIPLETTEDMAIIVTPKHHEKTTVKNVLRGTNEKFNKENVAAMLGVSPEDVEMTTMAELSTTLLPETSTVGTTEEMTESTTEGSATTTTDSGESTTMVGNALFFRL